MKLDLAPLENAVAQLEEGLDIYHSGPPLRPMDSFRSRTEALTTRWSDSSLGSRWLRQERDSTLNSISAIACPVLDTGFNQLPCLGV